MKNSEIRKDYIQEKYVIISPRRGKRPHDAGRIERHVQVKKADCVFCPENIDRTSRVILTDKNTREAKEPWAIKVIANKYPAVSPHNKKAYGRQEVVIETPDHLLETDDLSQERIAEILEVYSRRTKIISQDKKINYILIFKNDGGAAGASLQHAHSQIFATEFLPPHLRDKSQRVQAYKLKHGACVYCDVVKNEAKGPRLIFQNKDIICFCPWAPMHNYEVWIMPKRHLDNITQLTKAEKMSMAGAMKKILKKICELGLPYNYYFHQVIKDEDQHLYMKVTPRGSVWAGVEIGSGLIINPVAPEEAAKFYRGK
jgi:UDPglucose--hexose-1-phosphate uridylyltransferase